MTKIFEKLKALEEAIAGGLHPGERVLAALKDLKDTVHAEHAATVPAPVEAPAPVVAAPAPDAGVHDE